MSNAATIDLPGRSDSRQNLLSGTAVLILLALIAKLAHVLAPQLPGAVWALGFGMLAGAGAPRTHALPYRLPLSVGLILLGAQLDPRLFVAIGWPGLLAVGAVWIGVVGLLALAARSRLLTPRLAGLFALGLIGCGVSAIAAATQPDRRAAGVPAVYATLAVLVTGAAGLLVYPAVANALGLDATQFGTLAGLTIANSAESITTAALHSDAAMGTAAAYKLIVNALQGVPIVVYLWLFAPNQRRAHGLGLPRLVLLRVPFFVWGFAAVAVAGLLGAFSVGERAQLGHMTRYAFFIALVGVGFRTRLDVVRRIGLRPVLIGLAVWAVSAAAVLLWIQA
jgi:uncharacterized membrane protein YadS